MAQKIQLRNGTAAAWTAANPVLAIGEVGVETDTRLHKIGNGATAWNSLAYPPGGGGGGAWGSITGTLSAQADLQAELHANAGYMTPNVMGAGVIDTTKGRNTKSTAAAVTFSYSAQPAIAGTGGVLTITNTSANEISHVLPSSYSVAQNALITAINQPPNSTIDVWWEWDGTRYVIRGEPVRVPYSASFALDGTSAAQDYKIVPDGPSSTVVITSVVSLCDSGTATATVKLAGVALGGTPNAVSSAKQTQAHSTANVWAPGQLMAVGFTAGAVRPIIQVSGYYR